LAHFKTFNTQNLVPNTEEDKKAFEETGCLDDLNDCDPRFVVREFNRDTD